MAVFDALRHLSNYLYDAHTQGRHHLADLYELVQYAGNIVPRLYLMITVGSVYMSIPDAPVKEIMKDMMEIPTPHTRPVPAALSQQTDEGHSRDREKREMEHKDLRILVGTNLVRLNQLEGVDLDLYRTTILPNILQQVVSCKDVIAQEYLMEVVIQVFTDEFHLYTLGPFLSATAQLHPKVNIKQIVIALIDRLAAYAAREAENEDPKETKRQEEAAARRLAEKVKIQKDRIRQHSGVNGGSLPETPTYEGSSEWHSTVETAVTEKVPTDSEVESTVEEDEEKVDKGKEKKKETAEEPAVVELIKVRWLGQICRYKISPRYRLEYVDQVLGFAHDKIQEFSTSLDLHAPQTTANLAALPLAPINSYQSVLTLLALQRYVSLLSQQPFSTRRSLAHAVISSVLKNETVIESPEDVNGILELCGVLIKDQQDGTLSQPAARDRRGGPYIPEKELAEEQGWIARMVHLFRAESLDVQFERHFELGGERMRFTYPALITATIKLCRRYKNREHLEDWQNKVSTILKFIRQLISILATTVEAPSIGLRLFLLAAQVADECGFEDLTDDFYVQAFSVYEESISDSRAQLQAITLIIGTLQGAKVFSEDNYDTLITKAALHGARLLEKPHQATGVNLVSHLWWQEVVAEEEEAASSPKEPEVPVAKDENTESPKAYPHQDSKRVLECLQKALRIANSAIEKIVTVQLYCDTLDRYLYYLDHGAPAILPMLEGVHTPEMISQQFQNTLYYVQNKKIAVAGVGMDSASGSTH
ncbi:hypothetical protein EIP86_008991 [Pleurotus ostreatoroseus]|nr:hypothetical protein EIP86_008991 [Pleurotus ostreatoroseus]